MSTKEDSSSENTNPLGKRIALGTVWIIAARFLVRAMGLISTLILARLLVPADFGLVAIGITMMQLLQNLSDIGVSQTMVKFRNAGRSVIDTLFTLSVLRGLIVMVLLLGLSPFAKAMFGDPRAASVLMGISIVPLLLGLKNPKFHEFERNLDFSKTFVLDALAKSVSVAVAVSVALSFQTYWAIVLGVCAGAFTETVISYVLRPYRPRLSFAAFNELIGFTGWLAGVSFVAALNNKLDTLLLPKLAGTSATGAFYIGHQLADMPTEEVAGPIARAIYPGLSELQSETGKMKQTFLQGVEVLGAIAMPAALGCAFVADDLVAVLLGENWDAVVPVIQIYGPTAGLLIIFMAVQAYAVALGMTKFILYREIAYFLMRTPLFIWAAATFGLIGAVSVTAGANIFKTLLNLLVYQRVSGDVFWQPLWQVRRSLVACAAMAFYFLLQPLAPAMVDMLPAIRLLLNIVIGGGIYCAAHYLAWTLEGRPPGAESMVRSTLRWVRNGRAVTEN